MYVWVGVSVVDVLHASMRDFYFIAAQNHGQLLQMIAGLKAKMEAKYEAKLMAELDLRMKAQMKMLSGQYQERMGFQMAQMKVEFQDRLKKITALHDELLKKAQMKGAAAQAQFSEGNAQMSAVSQAH